MTQIMKAIRQSIILENCVLKVVVDQQAPLGARIYALNVMLNVSIESLSNLNS